MAGEDARPLGTPGAGTVRWGEHLCTFFTSPLELLNLQASYFKAGLEAGELCIWSIGGAVDETAALGRLKELVPQVEFYLAQQQLEIVPYQDWFFSDGRFDAHKAFDNWAHRGQVAKSRGFVGLRTSGSPVWLNTQAEWDEFLAYEQRLQDAIEQQQSICLCAYPIAGADEAKITGVYQAHHGVLMGKRHGWMHLHLRDRNTFTDT
jgi:DcmR-like sensory protein